MPMTLRFGWAETRSEIQPAELETRTLFFPLTDCAAAVLSLRPGDGIPSLLAVAILP